MPFCLRSIDMNYPGGKNGGGAYQNIINLIPPHETYIEPFLGSGAVWRHKKPASKSFVVEKDCGILAIAKLFGVENSVFITGDAVKFLYSGRFPDCADTFIYADPPYLMSTRSGRRVYRHEMTYRNHIDLLNCLISLSCRVAISGYRSGLYFKMLAGWRTFEFKMMTRGGTMRNEVVWMNYEVPERLHDYSFLGSDRTERQRIRRKIARAQLKLSALDPYERQALIESLNDL